MEIRVLKFLLFIIFCLVPPAALALEWPDVPAFLTHSIPPRNFLSMTGSEFARFISAMDGSTRERAILAQLTLGNLPGFLRRLKPVQLSQVLEDGKTTIATLFVMPDYLAIGSDRDFLHIPMALSTAVEIADRYGFILPTKKMVDAIYQQSAFHFTPEPMPPGPQMRSTAYYVRHNRKIMKQRQALFCPLDALVSGDKKDIVLTNRLSWAPGKIAIYGWHRLSGVPIQPLSTVHRADYADYSHGVRLVSDTVLINGEPRSIYEVLKDPRLAGVLSDEGPIRTARQLMALHRQQPLPPVDTSRFSTRSFIRQSNNSRRWSHP